MARSTISTTNGQSAKKFLMKTPINGARLSSSFGNRKHPILGYTKLHKGTDFAAPRGTPIYAAGNGVVERIGPYSHLRQLHQDPARQRLRDRLRAHEPLREGPAQGLRVCSRVR